MNCWMSSLLLEINDFGSGSSSNSCALHSIVLEMLGVLFQHHNYRPTKRGMMFMKKLSYTSLSCLVFPCTIHIQPF